MERSVRLDTPVGPVTVTATERAVTAVRFGAAGPAVGQAGDLPPVLRQAVEELREYFAGERREFTLPLAPAGTPFQQQVWAALREIPYGATCSYGRIAGRIGRPKACRAVGMANNRNPIAIVVPCHRVVGASGALVGYAAGLEVKEKLLALESMNNE
ncbi:MAG TPA: cysteine methyltransferase [Alistipes sp.]|uniref:methylated-DNA--[protein]-cysteine S-methyltransferase n=1 Tax=Alistipes muris TaxID=2941326 RepID=UPI000E9E2F90|nr:methylated-DNA--[protein]-cysteine S-methyltransferase [Alistipes muris]MCX4281723.1 methylated-DNA--[protein]-cysteine S-methyltransferase [Alistipes sp.]MDE6876801.1 methylated-DNA--[protein]-cysteine S-methyltransferase [Alistipes sp.]HBV49740.1 cysteine methyltransferase [Alistipes sp.]